MLSTTGAVGGPGGGFIPVDGGGGMFTASVPVDTLVPGGGGIVGAAEAPGNGGGV